MSDQLSIPSIEAKIAHVEGQLKPLIQQKSELSSMLAKLCSEEFIRVNRITLEDVQRRDSEFCGGVRHGHISNFGEWLKQTNCPKPWCEWNTMLYRTSDIIAGRMPESVARLEDVKGAK